LAVFVYPASVMVLSVALAAHASSLIGYNRSHGGISPIRGNKCVQLNELILPHHVT